MKKFLFSIGALCLLLTGCSKSPEKIVNEVYENAKQQQFGKIANLILPDSITPLTEEEQGRFEEMMKSAMGFAEYTEVAVDSVTVNPEGTEAKFVVSTKFNDGKSYTERGTLRKTASDKAFYWYNKAYGKGNTYAMWQLAECYEYGRGADKSKAKAKDM